jgi:hypothetical protein
MNKVRYVLFRDLPQTEKCRALGSFINAGIDDGYIYEMDSNGNVVFRFRSGGFYDYLTKRGC